ncbi:MAG: protein translocase subunit SecD [Chloroflexi bacterium]|nr:protein translocase subunit SecD [Chloroflexota bacterium]
MRRYFWSILSVLFLVIVAGLTLGFQTIHIGNFERGGDTALGLKLGLDLSGGSHLVYQAQLLDPETGEAILPTPEQMDSLKAIIERRVNSTGLGEPIIQLLGEDRLLIQLPGVEDTARAKGIIGETARLEFKHRTFNVVENINIAPEDILTSTISEYDFTAASTDPTSNATTTDSTSITSTDSVIDSISTTSTAATSTPADGSALPWLIIEFTEKGAQELERVLDEISARLETGLEIHQTIPDLITISITGKEFRAISMPGASDLIQRVPGSETKFAILLVEAAGQFPQPVTSTVAGAQQIFGDDFELSFSQVLGAVDESIGLTGDDLERAYADTHHTTGEPIVSLVFNDEGRQKFAELTSNLVNTGDVIAIFLDDQELIAPAVSSAITGGIAFIQGGDFTAQRVRDISNLLEAGRLPVPVMLVQERQVDAILGADSLTKSVIAGLIGLAMVIVFMVVYYRIPGIVAGAALIFYAALNLTIFKLLPVTLTLSGVAAAVLAIGMAVDANILVFERMKEELRAGRTLLSAINIGFNRAWTAIRDSHVATLISTAILFWFADTLGATVVQGFAATLAIGTIINLFTALTVTRVLLRAVTATRLSKKLGLFVPMGGHVGTPQRKSTGQTSQRS